MTLTDALARHIGKSGWATDWEHAQAEAAAILADPAFREALTKELAAAMHRWGMVCAEDSDEDQQMHSDDAAAIVKAMLP